MKKEVRRETDANKIRKHCVSTRFNQAELDELDQRRGKYTRGEYVRLAFFKSLPPPPPAEINLEAWLALSKVAGNLATLATAMRAGEYVELDEIKAVIESFRLKLIGAKE